MHLGGPPILPPYSRPTHGRSRSSQSPDIGSDSLSQDNTISQLERAEQEVRILAEKAGPKWNSPLRDNLPTTQSIMGLTPSTISIKPRVVYGHRRPAKIVTFTSEGTQASEEKPDKTRYYKTRASLLRQKPPVKQDSDTTSLISQPETTSMLLQRLPESDYDRRKFTVNSTSRDIALPSTSRDETRLLRLNSSITGRSSFFVKEQPKSIKYTKYKSKPPIPDIELAESDEDTAYTIIYNLEDELDDVLNRDQVLKGRWIIDEKISWGRMVQAYKAFDKELKRKVLVKLTLRDYYSLRRETELLMALERENVCKFIAYEEEEKVPFLVCELEGPNLEFLRDKFGPLSLNTVINLGIKMTQAIEKLHRRGWSHSCITPACFTISHVKTKQRSLTLNDYGMAVKSCRGKIPVLTPKSEVSMYGDYQFQSVNALNGREFDKSDDLWSMVYCVLYLKTDRLPWLEKTSRSEIADLKEKQIDRVIQMELGATFKGIVPFLNNIRFGEEPDYPKVHKIFEKMKNYYTIRDSDSYEWEKFPERIYTEVKEKSIFS